MNEREIEIMELLIGFADMQVGDARTVGARPMDVGGFNGSHHSYTLQRMERKGWVSNVGYGVSRPRGARRTCKYLPTDAGRAALAATK